MQTTVNIEDFDRLVLGNLVDTVRLSKFIDWVDSNSVLEDSYTPEGNYYPDITTRKWASDENLNRYLTEIKEIFGELVTIKILKGP